jgi:hypothetical protein
MHCTAREADRNRGEGPHFRPPSVADMVAQWSKASSGCRSLVVDWEGVGTAEGSAE